jgi:hypothetical protein
MPGEILSKKLYSILEPNAPLANVFIDLGTFGKNFTKQDHIVLVGGPGNSLYRNYNYSIEIDINFIAERTATTNMRFVNHFHRHEKPWMNRRVGNMNLQINRALMRHDKSTSM